MPDPASIGARIRAARAAKSMTQGDLAQVVGVSRSAVAQWETGRSGQITGNLARIAAALDVGVEHLTLGEDPRAEAGAARGDELAILRLYRDCAPEDKQLLLRMARRLIARVDATPAA
jgi:transcriptional regulator with XRE-family HTH domain